MLVKGSGLLAISAYHIYSSFSSSPDNFLPGIYFFFLGLFFWPLILVAFIAPFFVVSKPSIEKYIALQCPKCSKETIAIIPFKERYKAGKDFDFTKANNFDFQCQSCNAHMEYLNGYVIYKKIEIS